MSAAAGFLLLAVVQTRAADLWPATIRAGERCEPRVDVAPVLLGRGVHEVEGRAHVVQRAGDDGHVGLVDVRVVELQVEAEPLQEGVPGDPFALVDRLGVPGGGVRATGELLARGVTVGGVVGEPVLVPGDAQVRRPDGVQDAGVVDEGVGDRVDLLLGAFYIKEDIDQENQLRYGTQFRPYANILVQQASGGALNLPLLEATFGGGECNVAVSLANFGIPASFVTAASLPTSGRCKAFRSRSSEEKCWASSEVMAPGNPRYLKFWPGSWTSNKGPDR